MERHFSREPASLIVKSIIASLVRTVLVINVLLDFCYLTELARLNTIAILISVSPALAISIALLALRDIQSLLWQIHVSNQ